VDLVNGPTKTNVTGRQAITTSTPLMVIVAALLVLLIGPAASAAFAQGTPGEWDARNGIPLSDPHQNDSTASPDESSLTESASADPSPEPTDEMAADDSSEDMYGEAEGDQGGLAGMVLDWFKAIMGFVYDSTVGDLIKKVAEALQAGILGLPAPSGEVASMYEGMVGAMRPVILVGILVTALLMMLRTSNYDIAYAGFSALPRFIGLGIAFAFLPQFMEILSKMTLEVSEAFLPSADRAALAGAELFKSAVTNMLGAGFLNIILAIAFTVVGFGVVLVAVLKNILFQLLFIAGPFALASSVIPGVNHLAASWFRGVLACAAIPVLWSLELGIASVIVSSPEAIFGEMVDVLGAWSDGIFTSVGAILVLYVMYKTPFKVLEWAFESYDSSRGAWRGLARGVAVGLATSGIRSGVKVLAGAAAGGASGAATGVASGADANNSATKDAAIGAGGSRTGLGRGKTIRQITGQRASSPPAGEIGAAGSPRLSPPGGPQPELGGGSGQQRALPAASPEIERKYLKQDGTTPGFGKPRRDRQDDLKDAKVSGDR
jgi:hypothetical protein